MSYFIPLFYVDPHRIPNTDTGLANFYCKRGPRTHVTVSRPQISVLLFVFTQIAKSDANIWYINKLV